MVYFFCIARWIKCNHFFKVYIVCIARWINCNHFLPGLFRLQCKMNRTSLVSWRHSTGSLQISKERYFCLDCFIFFRIHYVYPIHYFTSENTGSLILHITGIVLVRVIELLMQSIELLVQVIEVLVQSIELLMQSIELLVRPLVQFWPNYNQEADYCIWSEVMMSDWRLHRRRCLFQSICNLKIIENLSLFYCI